MRCFDSHTHLNDPSLAENWRQVLARAHSAGVVGLMCIGYDLPSSRRAVEMAQAAAGVWAAVGIHPHDAVTAQEETLEEVADLARRERVVAIGETGLDFYRNRSPRQDQETAFRRQIQLANELGLPLIVHDREAHEDTLRILREEEAHQGVWHCFSGDLKLAEECLELGFLISLAGPLTYKNAGHLVEVARQVPLDRLLVETDSPYLSPEPYRGQVNEPARVTLVAEHLAALRGLAPDQVAEALTANAMRVFRLAPGG